MKVELGFKLKQLLWLGKVNIQIMGFLKLKRTESMFVLVSIVLAPLGSEKRWQMQYRQLM
jgi:hypothetical protein